MTPVEWNEFIWEFLRPISSFLRPGSCVVATSEVRTRRSISPNKRYAGGTASSLRRLSDLFSTRIELIREDVKDDSYTLLANIVTNILGKPAGYVRIPMTKGRGADLNLDFLRAAVKAEAIMQKGPHYHFSEKHLGLGEEKAARSLTNALKHEILEQLFE